jgi:hypothetical protein
MIEILRRLVLVVCIILAVATFFHTENRFYEIAPVDFTALYQESGDTTTTQAEFMASEIKGRLVEVTGQQWQDFFKRTLDVLVNQAPAADWKQRLGLGWKEGKVLFFKPQDPPILEITGELETIARTSLLAYISLKDLDPGQILSIRTQDFGGAKEYANASLLYPTRQFSLWLLLIGLAVYIFLPWRRPSSDAIAYPLRSNVIPLDVVGALMFLGFFTLPFFIITNTISQPSVFDPGWIALTIVCWILSLLGLVLVVSGLVNAVFWVEIRSDRLVINNLKGRAEYAFDEIASYEPSSIHLPPWLRYCLQLMVIPLFLSRQMLGAMALNNLIKQQKNNLAIHLKDSRRIEIWDNALPGFDQIAKALRDKKVGE